MSREGIRKKAEDILAPIIRETPIVSDQLKDGEDLYAKYTGGLTHQTLKTNWNTINPKTGKKGFMTGCNAFVGWYSSKIGTIYLGGFPIEEDLRKAGMHHAWVKSSSGGQPRYGDICLHASGPHVSVSLDMVGGLWERLNAGQGGPKRGADVIDVSRGVWSQSALKGWVDIEAYFVQAEPVPDWLLGWWGGNVSGRHLLLLRPHPSGEMERIPPAGRHGTDVGHRRGRGNVRGHGRRRCDRPLALGIGGEVHVLGRDHGGDMERQVADQRREDVMRS